MKLGDKVKLKVDIKGYQKGDIGVVKRIIPWRDDVIDISIDGSKYIQVQIKDIEICE